MILIDSNIIIYAASGKYPALVDWLVEQDGFVSAVSVLQVLGYHKLQAEEPVFAIDRYLPWPRHLSFSGHLAAAAQPFPWRCPYRRYHAA